MAQYLADSANLLYPRISEDRCKTGEDNVHQYVGTTEVHMAPKCSSSLTFLVREAVTNCQELYDQLFILKEGYSDTVDKVSLSITFHDRENSNQETSVRSYYIADGINKISPCPYDRAVLSVILTQTALMENHARKPRKETQGDHPTPIDEQDAGVSAELAAMQDAINDENRPFIPQAVPELVLLSPEGENRVTQVETLFSPVTGSMFKKRGSSEAAIDTNSKTERHQKKLKNMSEEQSISEALAVVENENN